LCFVLLMTEHSPPPSPPTAAAAVVAAQDTAKSAGKTARPDLIRALTHMSGNSIDWLMQHFGLNLDTVSRMAAHTQPRTHRGSDGGQFPGMMITYALVEALEKVAEADTSRAKIVNKATVTRLLRDADGAVVGVE
jgi:succinate dehydrogenase/fumarate reductase flavoprotein subunit